MKLRTIGAVVGVTAVLVAVPLTLLGGEPTTGPTVPVAHADPTILRPGDPGYTVETEWEKAMPRYTPYTPPSTVTVTPTTTRPASVKPAPSGNTIPTWMWVLGIAVLVVGGLIYLGTKLEDGDHTYRAVARTPDPDDDDEDDNEPADSRYPKPRNTEEEQALDEWEEREEAREQAGALPRRYPTTAELRAMARLGVDDYELLPAGWDGSALSYPAIPSHLASEPIPYSEPEVTPSAPVSPTSTGSLMDRLGK